MLNKNYKSIKQELERFSKEYLDGNSGVVELLDRLKEEAPYKIEDAVKTELLGASLVYIYLKQNKLNGRGGITAKKVGEFFGVKPTAITGKVMDIEFYLNGRKISIHPNEPYEFYDEVDRYQVSMKYYDFLESKEAKDINKSIKILKTLIKEDPDFFDVYITLSEYYARKEDADNYIKTMQKGYLGVMELIVVNGRFPDKLEWGYIENRHIIRMLFQYAMLLWRIEETKEALELFQQILKSNTNDNIGARYAIVAMLDGFKSMGEYESKFQTQYGLDGLKVEEWFTTTAKKHKEAIGWWFEAVGEEL